MYAEANKMCYCPSSPLFRFELEITIINNETREIGKIQMTSLGVFYFPLPHFFPLPFRSFSGPSVFCHMPFAEQPFAYQELQDFSLDLLLV